MNGDLNEGRNNNNIEKEDLKYSYDRLLDIWQVHNENYFKRVQIVMAVFQAVLFVAILKFIYPFPKSWSVLLVIIFISIIGISLSFLWLKLNERQAQYLEFCRRGIRNLESKLIDKNIPLEYFTTESIVFGPYKDTSPNTKGVRISIKTVNNKKKKFINFNWSKEYYPEDGPEGNKIHKIGKVKGGMVNFEKYLAYLVLFVWAFIIIIALIVFYFPAKVDCSSQNMTKTKKIILPNQSSQGKGRNRCRKYY